MLAGWAQHSLNACRRYAVVHLNTKQKVAVTLSVSLFKLLPIAPLVTWCLPDENRSNDLEDGGESECSNSPRRSHAQAGRACVQYYFCPSGKDRALRNGSTILYSNADTETQGRGFLANCQERLTLPPGINSGYLTVRTLTLCWFHGPHVSVCRRPKNGSRAVIKQKEGERVCV